MVKNARPTRTEAVDVSNCINDGADCIVSGDETATGDFPMNVISSLCKLCCETEKMINNKKLLNELILYTPGPVSNSEAVAQTVCQNIIDLPDVALIITIT